MYIQNVYILYTLLSSLFFCGVYIAAAFFCTYELTKRLLGPRLPDELAPVVHMTAATTGEVVRYDLISIIINFASAMINKLLMYNDFCCYVIL